MTSSLGILPMALPSTKEDGGQLPLATVIIGGLLVSPILTRLIIPALYQRMVEQNQPIQNLIRPGITIP